MPNDPFYQTPAWKRLRKIKLEQNPICEQCRRHKATDVDHKKSIKEGGDRLDIRNLMSMCHKCHSRKTYYIEVLGRKHVTIKDVDPATGMPMDPNHWWNKSNGSART